MSEDVTTLREAEERLEHDRREPRYEHVVDDTTATHPALPHHNDRASCALCLGRIRRVRASKSSRDDRDEE